MECESSSSLSTPSASMSEDQDLNKRSQSFTAEMFYHLYSIYKLEFSYDEMEGIYEMYFFFSLFRYRNFTKRAIKDGIKLSTLRDIVFEVPKSTSLKKLHQLINTCLSKLNCSPCAPRALLFERRIELLDHNNKLSPKLQLKMLTKMLCFPIKTVILEEFSFTSQSLEKFLVSLRHLKNLHFCSCKFLLGSPSESFVNYTSSGDLCLENLKFDR